MSEHNDAWFFPTPALAKKTLELFEFGPGEPLCVFGKRRTGKSTFLLREILPEARKRKWTACYVDLWTVRNDPTVAIVGALQRSYEELTGATWHVRKAHEDPGEGCFGGDWFGHPRRHVRDGRAFS
jgi:hypothetical protein